ncbi:MAG: 16S rRNA (cytidine(1402)-2'-O)-methyltransferase [Cyanobacteria bacterium REEB65]|nr:16S rRNA (cytidine(1402)-2'-O)-methyltransferase [Cyanobacteria bacterium REEB65]
MAGTLYIVGTPIGNLSDISLRALETLKTVGLVAAEDTRQTGKLLARYEISVPLVSYHEHSAARREAELLDRLKGGESIALVSDAGMPVLSDPGQDLVQAAAAAGFPVVVIPGPSALTAAVAVSGIAADRFAFEGFLPREGKARRRILRDLATERRALVFYEAPHRLASALNDMATLLGADRPIAVCREMTKLHEEVFRGTLAEAAARYCGQAARGEITLVVAGCNIKK